MSDKLPMPYPKGYYGTYWRDAPVGVMPRCEFPSADPDEEPERTWEDCIDCDNPLCSNGRCIEHASY
jgi:hypothetical protein